MDYIARIECQPPDFYPGSRPWSDGFGSCGSYPADDGLGATIMRLRVPAAMFASWQEEHWPHYRKWPFVRVSPRETPGLVPWLTARGYTLATGEALLVHDLPISGRQDQGPRLPVSLVRRVRTLRALAQVTALDHLVFPEDPLLSSEALHRKMRHLRALGRQLYYIEGVSTCAWAAAGLSLYDDWAYLWGGETHPDHRHQGFYRRLVATRLRAAARHGCRFAAVHANLETSAPILLGLGFVVIEQQQVYRPPQEKLSSDP